jgi:hypothetical protein
MLKDALKNEIVETRTLSYRRNVLMLGVIQFTLCWFSNINFDGLTFFGVKLESGTAGNRSYLLRAVVALLIYHVLFFTYYALRDLRNWLSDALEPPASISTTRLFFPEWQMFFKSAPKSKQWRAQPSGLTPEDWDWQENAHTGEVTFRPKLNPAPNVPGMENSYSIQFSLIRRFRERFLWFAGIDLGLPIIGALIAICAWFTG